MVAGVPGTLVPPEWALSVAHCVDRDLGNKGIARIGELAQMEDNLWIFSSSGYCCYALSIQSRLFDNNSTLLRFKGNVSITPVELDNSNLSNSFVTGRWCI